MNQKEVGTWHHHSPPTPAVLFPRNPYSAHSRSLSLVSSGIGFTSPPQTNSLMLRGPLSGQFMIFMIASPALVANRARAFFADLRIGEEALVGEWLDQLVRRVVGDGVGH